MNKYAFVEGNTERRLLKKLDRQKDFPESQIIDCKGIDNICKEINDTLIVRDIINHPHGILILCDCEKGKTITDIVRKFQNSINNLLKSEKTTEQTLQKDETFENIFFMEIPDIKFRLALHIANPPDIHNMKFINKTIDGYILSIGLRDAVLERFAKDIGVSKDILKGKIVNKIPEIARNNGITFDQAKDIIGVYMAMSRFITKKRNEKEDTFAGIVIQRSIQHDKPAFQETMASVLKTLDFLEVKYEI